MNNRTHFQNPTGSHFTKLECQLACALFLYVRTRRHGHGSVDHSQPPTLQMLNGIMQEARWAIWDGAHRYGSGFNAMNPNAPLNAYCLVRNLRLTPHYQGWYDEVRNHPEFWSVRAYDAFQDWILENSRLVQQYGSPLPLSSVLVRFMPADHSTVYDRMVRWRVITEDGAPLKLQRFPQLLIVQLNIA